MWQQIITSLIYFLAVGVHVTDASCDETHMIFSQNHDKGISPNSLTFVDLALNIFQIESVNDDSNTLTVSVLLELTWNDTRIQFKTDEKSYLRNKDFVKDCLWTPWDGLYVHNKALMEEQIGSGLKNRLTISKSENGVILRYHAIYKIAVKCPKFDFFAFPFDVQECYFVLYSRQRTNRAISINGKVRTDELSKLESDNTLQYTVGYSIVSHNTDLYPPFDGENNTYIGLKFQLTRHVEPYISYYICMEFVVIVSWISYWIPYDSIPGRMSPIVTVLLAIINGLIGISGDFTPGESSISMFEIYILGALFQVLITFFEYTIILSRVRNARMNVIDGKFSSEIGNKISNKIDDKFMILSPLINCVFLTVYFTVALSMPI